MKKIFMAMKKVPKLLLLIIVLVVCIITGFRQISSGDNLRDNSNSTDLVETLPRDMGRRILGIIPSDSKSFLVVTTEGNEPPFERCLRIITCSLNGRILAQSKLIIKGYSTATNDPEAPLVGFIVRSHQEESKGIWLVEHDGTKLQQKFLLIQEPEEELHWRKCWLLEVGGKKKLFVDKYVLKKIQIKGVSDWLPVYWLYCYTLDNNILKLEGKSLIAEGKKDFEDFYVECAVEDGEVFIWVCEEGGRWSRGILRVAKWQKDGELKWIECYRGNKGCLLSGLTVNRLYGSVAVIFEPRKSQYNSSAIICQIQDSSSRWVDLGSGFAYKHQLVRVYDDTVKWLLSGYKGWGIITLNNEFQSIGEIPPSPKFSHTTDYHLVCGSDQKVYITTVTKDGKLKIEKLEDFAPTQPISEQIEQEDLKELSREETEAVYKEYIEGEGRSLLRATDNQLARDIVSGDKPSISPLISYYRLLLRDEKRAKMCLSRQIEAIVKMGLGKEHWITNMQLMLYGELAINPLLSITDKGTPEERQIAVEVLYLVPDPAVTEELVKLLDRTEVRKDNITAMGICQAGITAGKPEAVDFLIKASTGRFLGEGDFEERQLRDESRRMLIELTEEYEGTPEEWSEESWRQWWEKHGDAVIQDNTLKRESLLGSEGLKQQHRLFQELAKILERKQ